MAKKPKIYIGRIHKQLLRLSCSILFENLSCRIGFCFNQTTSHFCSNCNCGQLKNKAVFLKSEIALDWFIITSNSCQISFFYFTSKIKDFPFLRHTQTTEVTTTTTGLYLFFLLPIFLMEEKFLDCFLLLPLPPSCVTLFLCYMKSNVAVSTFYSSSLLQRFHLLMPGEEGYKREKRTVNWCQMTPNNLIARSLNKNVCCPFIFVCKNKTSPRKFF